MLFTALTNGLFGPLAHGHAMAGGPSGDALQIAAAADLNGEASHANCHATEPDDDGSSPPGDHAGGKHPAKSGLLCSGAAACCAAVAVIELPIIGHRDRVAPGFSLRPVLIGLTPPVGERPPSHL